MSRRDELQDREARIIKFIRAVNETAARMNTKDTTLIAIAFVFCLMWEALQQIGNFSGGIKSELFNARDKWTWKQGDE